jgi:tRNA U34 2-thiouridine synthase MnmA/TrmU
VDVRKSLKTKSKRDASYSLAKHLEHEEKTFAVLRSGLMTDAEIRKLAEDYQRETLAII